MFVWKRLVGFFFVHTNDDHPPRARCSERISLQTVEDHEARYAGGTCRDHRPTEADHTVPDGTGQKQRSPQVPIPVPMPMTSIPHPLLLCHIEKTHLPKNIP